MWAVSSTAVVVVVVVVVVAAPRPIPPTMLVDILTTRALGRGLEGGMIVYNPASTSQFPPNLIPAFN